MAALSSTALYGRRARLTIGRSTTGPLFGVVQGPPQNGAFPATALVISGEGDPNVPGLRIQAKICKTLQKEPNTCEIRVTNLTASTRQAIQTANVEVFLEAGYAQTGLSTFFSGQARFVDHVRDKADWHTVLKCGDGNTWFQWSQVAGNWKGTTAAPAVSVWTVLEYICAQTGIALADNDLAKLALVGAPYVYRWGYSVQGSAQRAVDALLKGSGFSWSIQNGQLQVLSPGQSLGTSIPLVSPETGLIGSPEMGTPEKAGKPALCKFKSLLLPTKPGARVHLKSDRYDTDLRVIKCEFDLDTHSGPWFTTIYGEILK